MAKKGSIRKKGNGVELRIYVYGEQMSFTGTNEADARRKHREFVKALDVTRKKNARVWHEEQSVVKQKQERITYPELRKSVGESMLYWMENYYFGTVKDSTYDETESIYRTHVVGTLLSLLSVEDVTAEDAQHFADEKLRLLSIGTVRNIVSCVSKFYTALTRFRIVTQNPITAVSLRDAAGTTSNLARIYSDSDLTKLLTITDDVLFQGHRRRYRYAPLFIFILNTGLRHGEALALKWDSVDLDARTASIDSTVQLVRNRNRYQSGKEFVKVITSPKTRDSVRVLPLNESALQALRLAKERNKAFGIESELCFPGRDGREMRQTNTLSAFKAICSDIGIECLGVHALRHTFASKLIREGVDIKVVSELLGHSNVMFTYNVYVHVIKEQKASAIKLLDFTKV